MTKSKTGTREWSERSFNFQRGCQHNCRYCYAKYEACHRRKICTPAGWAQPVINAKQIQKSFGRKPGVTMIPSTHDITLFNLAAFMEVGQKMLEAGNQLLITSKPTFSCISRICDAWKDVKDFQRLIEFRFTIGSCNDAVLKFWDRNASGFDERLGCLKYAHTQGYSTSVSCEPYLDEYPTHVYDVCEPHITDTFWLGKIRNFDSRVDLGDVSGAEMHRFVELLKAVQSDEMVLTFVDFFKGKRGVRFKDSITKVINRHRSSDVLHVPFRLKGCHR